MQTILAVCIEKPSFAAEASSACAEPSSFAAEAPSAGAEPSSFAAKTSSAANNIKINPVSLLEWCVRGCSGNPFCCLGQKDWNISKEKIIDYYFTKVTNEVLPDPPRGTQKANMKYEI